MRIIDHWVQAKKDKKAEEIKHYLKKIREWQFDQA